MHADLGIGQSLPYIKNSFTRIITGFNIPKSTMASVFPLHLFFSTALVELSAVKRLVLWKSQPTIHCRQVDNVTVPVFFSFLSFFSPLAHSELGFLALCSMLTCAWTTTSCLKVQCGVILNVSHACFNEMPRTTRLIHNYTSVLMAFDTRQIPVAQLWKLINNPETTQQFFYWSLLF